MLRLAAFLLLVPLAQAGIPAPLESRAARASLSDLPVSAQGAISAALGRDSASYRAAPTHAGFTAQNHRHGFRIDYRPDVLTVVAGQAQLGLRLAALGRGAVLEPVEAVSPKAQANRVEYPHAGVTAWYENGPLGLQQGFTLPSPPAGESGEPLTLTLALSGDLTPQLDDGSLLLVTASGRPSLRGSMIPTPPRMRCTTWSGGSRNQRRRLSW